MSLADSILQIASIDRCVSLAVTALNQTRSIQSAARPRLEGAAFQPDMRGQQRGPIVRVGSNPGGCVMPRPSSQMLGLRFLQTSQ